MPKNKAQAATRNDPLTARVPPDIKYFMEVAARAWRTTVSGFLELSAEAAFENVKLDTPGGPKNLRELKPQLWDVDEEERFIKLALLCPNLLTYTEQRIWKLIRETSLFWKGDGWWDDRNEEFRWSTAFDNVAWREVRKHWNLVHAIANGDADRSELDDLDRAGKAPPPDDPPPPPGADDDAPV